MECNHRRGMLANAPPVFGQGPTLGFTREVGRGVTEIMLVLYDAGAWKLIKLN